MLNRKISNYLFYGVLVIIAAVVLLIRSITLGNINDKITNLERSNISLQAQNDSLEKLVEDYKEVESSYLYQLYDRVPNHYSQTELTYFTIAQLEAIGIDESADFQRRVVVDSEITFQTGTTFGMLSEDFKIVEVQVYFTTLNSSTIDEFVDLLFDAEQIFIINTMDYYQPDGESYTGVTINFLAFYEIEDES